MKASAFFILWNPESHLPPRVKFWHVDDAKAAAVSMAQKHGEQFYVMGSIAVAEQVPPIPPVRVEACSVLDEMSPPPREPKRKKRKAKR